MGKKRRGRARPDEPLADWCEVGRVGVCTGRAVHRHHRLIRSQGGTDERENTLDVCAACHDLIHSRKSLAFAHGWLLHRPPPGATVPPMASGDAKGDRPM